MWVLGGSAIGVAGVGLLRAALDGDRRNVAAGWLLLLLALCCFVLAMGGERGAPAAFAAISFIALIVVAASTVRRPWRLRARAEETPDTLSPVRRESAWRAASRWVGAGPLALAAATAPVAAIAAALDARNNDGVVLSLVAILIAWSALGAWAFSSRRPFRTTALIAALALIGAAAAALGAAS